MGAKLGQEHKMMVFESKVLRIFGSRWDGTVGGWGKMHNKQLHNAIRMIKSRRMRRAGHVACMGVEEEWILVRKPEGKRV
jgi:hypothetical protein